jgi:light-regulated signal transduction histidine kinase (bacteriophytochrome)
MTSTAAISILLGVLLTGLALIGGMLLRTRRSMAALQLERQRCGNAAAEMSSAIAERELSERKLVELKLTLERQLAARTAELEQAKRDLDAFSYSVSHDLSAPLRTINGFSDLLKDEAPALSGQGREWLARIHHNSQRMADMIGELLRLSRVGREGVKLQSVDLNGLAAEAAHAAGAAYPNTEVNIAPLPEVVCDPALLRQALQNLLENAFKFSAGCAAPGISVGVQSAQGERCFFVRDNGAGFNMRYAGKLFGMFQRMHKESDFPGLGAGLAIARKIIQLHQGRIWAESSPGEGASFYFTLGTGKEAV